MEELVSNIMQNRDNAKLAESSGKADAEITEISASSMYATSPEPADKYVAPDDSDGGFVEC